MKIGLRLVLASVALALPMVGCGGEAGDEMPSTRSEAASNAPGRFAVIFKSDTLPSDAGSVIAAAGGQLVEPISEIGIAVATTNDPYFVAKLSANSEIDMVGEDVAFDAPNGYANGQDYAAAPGAPTAATGPTDADTFYSAQWNIRRIHADKAWATTSGSHKTVVAIVDSGIAWNHPDLASNVVYNTCFTSQASCNPYPTLFYHGTAVAGYVAAAFGGGGVVGVGPNLGLANYNIYELIGGAPRFWFTSAITAIVDVADHGFPVLNFSGGALFDSSTAKALLLDKGMHRAIQYAKSHGTLVVAAVGNNGMQLNPQVRMYPGTQPDVLGVSATAIRTLPEYPAPGSYDIPAFYSNYGDGTDIAAPAGDYGPAWPPVQDFDYFALTTSVRPDPSCAPNCPVTYQRVGGTSAATPHVAGVAALVVDRLGGAAPPGKVADILLSTADNLGDPLHYGAGLVDAAAAVAATSN